MQDSYEIKKASELVDYVTKLDKRDPYYDFDSQLQTNYGYVYELKNGQVVFIANDFKNDGLIFKNKNCFKQVVDADRFPIENPDKTLYDTEIDRIKTINKQIDFYRSHLNTILKFSFTELNKEAGHAYIKKVIGRTIKKLTTDVDAVALIAILGEIMRQEIKGKWVLEKWYGTYNPYFMPKLLTKSNKIIAINDNVLLSLKWKVSSIDTILDEHEGILSLKEVKKYHECIILKD